MKDHNMLCDIAPGPLGAVTLEAGEIVGFQPRHDYSYRLRVERFGMFPDGMTGAPPYVPAYGYRWLETLERTPSD